MRIERSSGGKGFCKIMKTKGEQIVASDEPRQMKTPRRRKRKANAETAEAQNRLGCAGAFYFGYALEFQGEVCID